MYTDLIWFYCVNGYTSGIRSSIYLFIQKIIINSMCQELTSISQNFYKRLIFGWLFSVLPQSNNFVEYNKNEL